MRSHNFLEFIKHLRTFFEFQIPGVLPKNFHYNWLRSNSGDSVLASQKFLAFPNLHIFCAVMLDFTHKLISNEPINSANHDEIRFELCICLFVNSWGHLQSMTLIQKSEGVNSNLLVWIQLATEATYMSVKTGSKQGSYANPLWKLQLHMMSFSSAILLWKVQFYFINGPNGGFMWE